MKMKEMNEIVNILDKECNLGRNHPTLKEKYVLGYNCFNIRRKRRSFY